VLFEYDCKALDKFEIPYLCSTIILFTYALTMKIKTLKSLLHLVTIVFLTSITTLAAKATAPNAPSNLRCSDKSNPIGTDAKPYFGWMVTDPDNNEIQSAYQVLVSSTISGLNNDHGDIWDSEKTPSRLQNYIALQGQPLQSATRYYWKVRTWDKDGNVSPYSSPAFFETGLLSNSDWAGAKWIRRNTTDGDDYTYFRKKLSAFPHKTIQRAVIYIAACHSYELYINGKFIAKGFDNHYPAYSYYNAWDVSEALAGGSENVIACLTHWYGGGQGRATGARGLLLKAIVDFTDGTKATFGTDSSWRQIQAPQWVPGQRQRNSEGIGRVEKFDSRKIIDHWNGTDFDDSSWKYATEIGSHPVAPWTGTLRPDLTRVIENEIKPASVVDLGGGRYVIDLGKIFAGSFKISFRGGHAGDTIRMYGGFALNADGTVSKKLNQETNLNFYFIHNGAHSVFNPYVYLGLRYLQVENAPNALTAGDVSFVCRHFELDSSHSSFQSSNAMLNNVWDLMIQSLMVGAQEGFVDTPTREKGSFLGDGWSQAVPALSTMYDRVMNLRVLNEFLDSQHQYWPDGRLNAVYPNVDGARDIPDYTQSFLVWVWDYYMQTGNIDFLKANYEKLKKVADYVDCYKNKTTGLIQKLEGGSGPYLYGIIDWPVGMRYGYDMSATSRTVINAYAYADFDILSKIAETIGKKTDTGIYQSKADSIKKAMNALLINPQGVYIDGLNDDRTPSSHVSQHANIFPLAFNMVPAANRASVIAEIKKREMNVGMICLRWLPEALGQANQGPHLFDLYTNTSWDGWAKTIALGGTVTWESWDANVTNESMSHPWGAVGLLAMQNYMLGIQSLKPQNEFVQIKPLDFGDRLSYVRGSYATDQGDILVHWVKNSNSFSLEVTIPVNIIAKVYVPRLGAETTSIRVDGVVTNGQVDGDYLYLENIGSGKHTFERSK
jgi:alpha-L-rhamnosidase